MLIRGANPLSFTAGRKDKIDSLQTIPIYPASLRIIGAPFFQKPLRTQPSIIFDSCSPNGEKSENFRLNSIVGEPLK